MKFFKSAVGFIISFLKSIFTVLLYPFFYASKLFESRSKLFSHIFSTLLASFFIVTWTGVYYISFYNVKKAIGLVPVPIPVAGTGSMYPTFPKSVFDNPIDQANDSVVEPKMYPYPNGLLIKGTKYFGHKLGKGDIVVVENEAIDKLSTATYGSASGWVKRLIGLPGDTLQLRDGIVYLNGNALKESYTAKSHSTFGENFLKECENIIVPDNSIFVLGDNRKASADSREIGFINISDVSYVIPFSEQKDIWDKNYRDTSSDLEDSDKIKLNAENYLKLLNKKREALGLKPMKYQPKLERSAKLRGEVILKYDDSSYEATRSGYTQDRAFSDAGYSNIVYGESLVFGFYESEELVENQFEFPETSNFLLNPDFDDFGIAQVEGMLNNCPAQVIVSHFAGYKPPVYSQEDILSWQNARGNLVSIIPSWEKARDFDSVNQTDLEMLISLLKRQLEIVNQILYKLENNLWLNQSEKLLISEYETNVSKASELAKKLNE